MSDPPILFRLNGATVPRVHFADVSIRDVLGAQPNTATLVVHETAPSIGSAIEIGIGSFAPGDLLFAGEIQHLASSYESQATDALARWPADLIDYTFALSKRRPLASYVQQSATTIAQDLVSRYAPGFSAAGVVANLPLVTINFDGSQTLMEAITAIAQVINGRAKVDYSRTLHLYLPPQTYAPDPEPLTYENPPLNTPPIAFDVDLSQVRTRVYGRGYGEKVPTAVGASETILPITDGATFTATGGKAITGLTADGAKTQVISYTSVARVIGGSIVGGSAAPSGALLATPQPGTGLASGTYQWAYTWVTASGETVPSPVATAVTGAVAPPTTHPTLPGEPAIGNGPEPGVHRYGLTFVSGSGETTVLTSTNQVTTYDDGAPPPPGTASQVPGGNNSGAWPIGARVKYALTCVWAGGETVVGKGAKEVTETAGAGGIYACSIRLDNIPIPPAGVTSKTIYRYVNGTPGTKRVTDVSFTWVIDDGFQPWQGGSPTGSGTVRHRTVAISGL